MARLNDYYKILEQINNRFDSVEELLKILAINELVNELNVNVVDKVNENVDIVLQNHGIFITKVDNISEKKLFYLQTNNTWQIKALMNIQTEIIEAQPNCIPVFQFKRVYGMQRKRLEQEKISYYIENKELHIFI